METFLLRYTHVKTWQAFNVVKLFVSRECHCLKLVLNKCFCLVGEEEMSRVGKHMKDVQGKVLVYNEELGCGFSWINQHGEKVLLTHMVQWQCFSCDKCVIKKDFIPSIFTHSHRGAQWTSHLFDVWWDAVLLITLPLQGHCLPPSWRKSECHAWLLGGFIRSFFSLLGAYPLVCLSLATAISSAK